MKRIGGLALIMLGCVMIFGGCAGESKETVTDRKIPAGDITEFYYTFENINANAFYQRYRFYSEDGKHLFYHETREKPGQYGPATEEDITSSGTAELSEEEWKEFLSFLKDGTVTARRDDTEAGDSGPWMFIYWKKDKGKYQVFEFASYEERVRFEGFCSELAQKKSGRGK